MSEMSRRYCGRAFQSVGPAMLNALLPAKVDRVNGTHSRLCSWELLSTICKVLGMYSSSFLGNLQYLYLYLSTCQMYFDFQVLLEYI